MLMALNMEYRVSIWLLFEILQTWCIFLDRNTVTHVSQHCHICTVHYRFQQWLSVCESEYEITENNNLKNICESYMHSYQRITGTEIFQDIATFQVDVALMLQTRIWKMLILNFGWVRGSSE
jgi:hypothetical protein